MTDLIATPRALIEDSLVTLLILVRDHLHPEPTSNALETGIHALAIALDARDWITANAELRMIRIGLAGLPDQVRGSALLDFEAVRTAVDEIEALDTMETRNVIRFPVARRSRPWAVIVGGVG